MNKTPPNTGPIRGFSQGFHPAPRISFPDALPTGVESDTEIIDLELFQPTSAEEVVTALNQQLPEGFRVLEGASVDWKTPSPSASIMESVYRVQLPENPPTDLLARMALFLEAETVAATRDKGNGRTIEVDLRPGVTDLELDGDTLCMTLSKGSPTLLAGHLLELSQNEVRRLKIRKIGVTFAETAETA